MINVPIIFEGHSFLKHIHPLVARSNKCGVKPIIFACAQRMGKSYDNVTRDHLTKLTKGIDHEVIIYGVNERNEVSKVIDKNFQCVIGQDIYYHGSFLKNTSVKKVSLCSYFDTLHNAVAGQNTNKTYSDIMFFPNDNFSESFNSFAKSHAGKSFSLGLPITDSLFRLGAVKKKEKQVVFFCPVQQYLTAKTNARLETSLEHIVNLGYKLIVKQRKNVVWKFNSKILNEAAVRVDNDNTNYYPYQSLALINDSEFCIGGYTTAAVECYNLCTPYFNIDLDNTNLGQSIQCMKSKYEWAKNLYFQNDLFLSADLIEKNKSTEYYTSIHNEITDNVSDKVWKKIIEECY